MLIVIRTNLELYGSIVFNELFRKYTRFTEI